METSRSTRDALQEAGPDLRARRALRERHREFELRPNVVKGRAYTVRAAKRKTPQDRTANPYLLYAKSQLANLNLQTNAVRVPKTIRHVNSVPVKLKRNTTAKDVVDVWGRTKRLKVFRGAEGVASTAQIMESRLTFRGAARPPS